MKYLMPSLCLSAFLALALEAGEPLKDKLNLRLGEILKPGAGSLPTGHVAIVLPEPRALTDPWLVPPIFQGTPARPGNEAGKSVRPHLTREPAPLAMFKSLPEAPQQIALSTTDLVAVPGNDVNPATPVPILSQPTGDRASLGDATVDASIAAILAQDIPLRDAVVPFTALNVPDPFEFRQAMKLVNPPAESEMPLVAVPRIILPPSPPPTK